MLSGQVTMQHTYFYNSIPFQVCIRDSKTMKTPQDSRLMLTKSICEDGCKHEHTIKEACHIGVLFDDSGDKSRHRLSSKSSMPFCSRSLSDTLTSSQMHTGIQLQAAPMHGFIFSNKDALKSFLDTDWAGNIKTRRNTSDYSFMMNGWYICWCSKKQ